MKLTPKEKAKELFSKYQNIYLTEDSMGIDDELAKQCTLIAVDEIINTLNCDIRDLDVRGSILLDLIQYWKEVKEELLKM